MKNKTTAGLSFLNGAAQGAHTVLDFNDRLKGSKRNDLLFEQQQEDRTRNLERQDTLMGREDADYERNKSLYEEGKLDRKFTREQAELSAAHLELQRPIEIQAMNANLQQLLSGNALNAANLRLAKQKETNMLASAKVREAIARFSGGDYEGAATTFQGLEEFGFDVGKMTDGGGEFVDSTVKRLLAGEIGMQDQDVQELAKRVLTPALVQSGRDMTKWEFGGLVPVQSEEGQSGGNFTVALRNKDTGEIKPATIGGSAEEGDPATVLTAKDLLASARTYSTMSKQAMEAKMAAASARFGDGTVADKSTGLDRAEQMAKIKKMEAETAKINGAADKSYSAFVESYEGLPGMEAVAKHLTEQPGFDPDSAVDTIAGVREVMTRFDEEAPMMAMKIYEKEQLAKQAIGGMHAELVEKNPELDPEKLMALVEKWQHRKIDDEGLQSAIGKLKNRKNSVVMREAKREDAVSRMEKMKSDNPSTNFDFAAP